MQHNFDVIVVGGGMVGSALASRLAQLQFRVALVENRRPVAFASGQDYDLRVSALSPASHRFLTQVGAWSRIQSERHSAYDCMQVWERQPESALKFSAGEGGCEQLGWIVENSLILDALWADLQGVQVFCPDSLSDLQAATDAVDVTLQSGLQLQASLVVAADGAGSITRRLAGIETYGWRYAQQGIVCVVQTAHPHADTAWQRFLPTGPLAFLPLSDGRCSIVWSADDARASELMALPDTAFAAELGEASQYCLGEIQGVGPRATFPLHFQQAERYVTERLCLVGDAAHVIHPLAGQGVNLGFADAACLAETLQSVRSAGRDIGYVKGLRRYERSRKADDALMAAVTDGLKKLYGTDQPVLRGARRQGLRAVNAIRPLKGLLMRQALG